jgi:hypothetical protein
MLVQADCIVQKKNLAFVVVSNRRVYNVLLQITPRKTIWIVILPARIAIKYESEWRLFVYGKYMDWTLLEFKY